jgi:hypothetical protein
MTTDIFETVSLPTGMSFRYARLEPSIITTEMRADPSHPDWDDVDLTRDELVALHEVPFSIGVSAEDDTLVGFGEFDHRSGPDGDLHLFARYINVSRMYRRRGVATAIFVEAERVSGLVLAPNDEQFAAGRLLWLSPDRPFGRGVADPDGPVHREPWYSDVALDPVDLARISDWVPTTEEELLDGYDPELAAVLGACGPRPAGDRPGR